MNEKLLWKQIRNAYMNVPLYSNLLKPEEYMEIEAEGDLTKLPVINKSQMVDNESACLTASAYMDYMQGKLIRERTSGSSGQYLEIIWNRTDFKKSLIELWMRRVKYYDVYPHNRLLFFFTSGTDNCEIIERKYEFGINKDKLTLSGLDEVYDKILWWNPEWMLLQPSTAVILCEYIKMNKCEIPPELKYIEFSGELLTDEVREMTKTIFNCNIANQYGANEVNSIAYECPYGNMHVMKSNVYVEIADEYDNAIKDECEGRVLLTSLTNSVMPFIRYDIGDRARLYRNKNCSCGCSGTIIELETGRKNDYIRLSDKRRIGSYLLVKVFNRVNMYSEGAVKQFYVEQTDFDKFEVKLFIDDEIDESYISQLFLQEISDTELSGAEFTFLYTDKYINNLNNNKYVYFRSCFRLG